MPTPTQRHNHGRIGRSRSHQHIDKQSTMNCAQCKKPIMPHHACAFCGTYKGRQILKSTVAKPKTKAKASAK